MYYLVYLLVLVNDLCYFYSVESKLVSYEGERDKMSKVLVLVNDLCYFYSVELKLVSYEGKRDKMSKVREKEKK